MGDCALLCPQYGDSGRPLTVVATVEDARGNPVLAASAVLDQGGVDTFACVIDDSKPMIGCNETVEGAGTLRVEAQGQKLMRELNVGVVSEGSCDSTQEVVLRLPGPGCPKPRGTAIEGRLLDTQGKEIKGGTVTVELYGRRKTCRVDGARFQCASMSPYMATYTLEARFGVSIVQRQVVVSASDCQVVPTDATINLAAQCEPIQPREPAVTAIVALADAAATTVQILADGRSSMCALVIDTPPELLFECPPLTATGGGTYHVLATVGHASQSQVIDITDDGCAPDTDTTIFTF